MGTIQEPQLTMNVRDHPNIVARRDNDLATFMTGTLKLTGELPVDQDFNAGDALTVTVADADGLVIASGRFECKLPQFQEIKEEHAGVIGTNRAHTAKMVDA